jgi:hypothetical protein
VCRAFHALSFCDGLKKSAWNGDDRLFVDAGKWCWGGSIANDRLRETPNTTTAGDHPPSSLPHKTHHKINTTQHQDQPESR